ncbi:ATPase, histidine kinase-, DNA gyrase B (macronuclear) [Tetrahymena thermophila SB210]|uniref:ATPase, histidine kinase-, DNA gyrase B n=1 Tax=Tetrahymena thermophila (strain SB210) TaxID=312017 RepID=I7MKZ4_TETTS|nr:ATPase, histidine kinase-, DNA gyrase B [Tetrahymena thermophila SB210]EAS00744.2 ATPase, histidine kinase-, DNA gyrase B [Tetrahymena thermophila SB210]|eukprot:XP_001020989.2 ATPase, histidine kinase-, DNA gyrase B [Tetrahymena thermophila SB210]
MISPQAKAEQSNIMSQQKFIKNKQLQQSEVQIDYSNIIEESQNNLNASYCGNKLNEIKKSQGIANQQTPNQLQGQFSNNSQQWQLNAIQKKNSFQVQECEQNISQDFFFKQRGDLKNNQELLDLIKSKSDCSIKDILSIILDPKTYHNPKKQHLGCQVNRLIELRNDKQEKGNQHGYSNYDSYDSYTPINSKLLQQQSVQKQMLCQNNKSFQHMFDIVVDDCSILIQKLIQPSNIIVTIKITILQQQSLCKEDNFENLFAFFEFTTSSQNMNQNCKQEQEKVKKIEHFAQSISWLERKLTTVLEPCIQRANLFKQYCKRGFQNFTAEEQKSIFIIPFYNSFQLIFNIIQNSRNFVQIKEDKFCLSLSSFNILNLLSKCLDIFKQQAKYQNIYLELKVQKSAKLFLCSDKLRLQQLIVNMLASSIKHTLVGKVQIQIDYIPLQQMYKISIQDTGIGIDSHACQKISQIMNLNPDELSEYENIFSNNFSFIKDHHNIDDKTDFSNAFSPYTKQQKTSSKEESSLKYIKFLMLNFIAKKLGSNNSIQLNSKKGIGTQLVFYVQDQSEIQSQINQKMHHTNESLNTQSDNQSQLQCSFEQEINMKNQQARQFRYSEKAFNHFQYQNPNQQNKEPVEQNLQILNDKRNEEHKSDFNLNSQNMQSDKDKLSQKDQSSSNKNSRFGRKSLFSDAQNLIYEESCNVQSEYNSRLSQNFSQKKTPKCEQFVVTHKIEKNYNQQDNSVETSLFQKNKIQCSIKLRKCKTQAGLENVSQSQQNQDNIVEEYDVYQFGIERNQRNINKLIDSQSENNFEENNINQQFTSFQNPNLHQKYPTSFYKCENPMQATNSDQNGSFSDFSSLLQNYFAPSKSQNAILFNNQAHKQSPRSKNNHEYSKNFEGLIKTKSPFKKAYSMRHASSEFIQSEYKSHNQKNTEAQNSFEQEDIQKYYVQDSPLFIQSQKVIKALNEDSHSQNVIKKVHTEFTQCNQTIFQGSPSSSASIQSKKTEKNSKINSKLKMCSCNQILVVEQTENSLKYIKQSLFNLKLEADCSLIGKQLLQKVKHKFQNSICCPKYKLIFIDREFSQQKASKAVQNINKIYSLIDDRIKPIFCSCEPNKNQSKQNLQDQEDETFDFCFYKKIYSDTFNDLIKLAIA